MPFLFFVNSFFFGVSQRKLDLPPRGGTSQYLQQRQASRRPRATCAVTQYQLASHTQGISNLGPRDNEELSQFAPSYRLLPLHSLRIWDAYQQVV